MISMKSKFALHVVLTLTVMLSGLAATLVMSPGHAAATDGAANVETCKHDFLGLKPWFQYIGAELDDGSDDDPSKGKVNKCNVKCFNFLYSDTENNCGQKGSDVPLVLLAVIDDLLRIAGIIAVAYVFVGAFKYVGSQGNSEATANAQGTIINALIGVAIAMTAVAIVSFIGNTLGS